MTVILSEKQSRFKVSKVSASSVGKAVLGQDDKQIGLR